MKDWEHSLEVRERRVGQHDEGLACLMKDLRIREVLRNELEERVINAREEHKREIQVVLVYVCYCVLVNIYVLRI